ncbi:MAG: stage IV sporulation protein A [Clostridia bacterium]|nr:stage IV sporulation protein A [Clostridia bacterium]
MEKFDLYNDIAERTGGDIYIGVVGPVRTGKSTFISRFMQTLVLPNIENAHDRQRATDELPQSGSGKAIMTMQPKFVPNEAINVKINDATSAKFRLIDCVGYLVDGVSGHLEEDGPRLVKTPWSEEDVPFSEAAEVGTRKVIKDHSTIGILVTTDGTIGDLARINYVRAEERVAKELREEGKPFVIVLNTVDPTAIGTQKLRNSLEEKYGVPVLAINVKEMGKEEIEAVLTSVLYEFPAKTLKFNLPNWVRALPYENPTILDIIAKIKTGMAGVNVMKDAKSLESAFEVSEDIEGVKLDNINLSTGTITYTIKINKSLFYKMLSNECNVEIQDDFYLMSYMKHLAHAKVEYDKLKSALDSVKETGYGVVMPSMDEMTLEEPQIIKKGANSGVKLRASAPSLHIMRVDVETEISPAVGSPEQSEGLGKYLLSEFENNPQGIWETNMFGKPLSYLVREGINTKLNNLPQEAQTKMRKTLTKIVNEGKGGIICILL